MNIRKYIVIGLLSLSLIGLELIWTRIFSAEFYYTFSFLILSLSIMGLSLGSLFIRLFTKLGNLKFLSSYLALSALFSLISPILIFKLNLNLTNLFTEFATALKLLLAIGLLSSSFFFGGMALGLLFKTNHSDMPKLYMADMVGAGLSVLLSVLLMNQTGTQTATFLIALPMLLAAFISGGQKFIAAISVIVFAFVIGKADTLLESEREERAPVIYKHWDAMSKIKLYDFDESYRGINIDNLANSPVIKFDGNWQDSNLQVWNINVKKLIDQFDDCTFLSLGAGGGSDVLQALAFGANEVHAVEVNPHINKMMTEGDKSGYIIPDSIENKNDFQITTCNDFSGNIYNDPRVKVISEDARTYIKRFSNKFDVIYSLSSNTWAALGSGSFAFAENYIFTKEAFKDYWCALSEKGYLSMEHQMYMPRLVSALMEALMELQVENPSSHFAVYNIPKMRRNLLLLSKEPLSQTMIETAFGELQSGAPSDKELLFPLSDSTQNNMINRIVLSGWQTEADSAAIDISPTTDNKPFVAQMGLWRNFNFKQLDKVNVMTDFRGFPLTKSLLVAIIMVILVIMIPLLILPYFFSPEKLKAAPWFYFFSLGIGYIVIEVVLIQKYSLFIGASFYSIATVLLTMLLSSGIGSRFSQKISNKVVFGCILLFLAFTMLFFNPVVNNLASLPIFWRSMVTALIVFPLGFFMGMPFPKGGLIVKDLIDWGFAVNGVASVLGSTFIMLVVFAWGFNAALLVGGIFYILAFILIQTMKKPEN